MRTRYLSVLASLVVAMPALAQTPDTTTTTTTTDGSTTETQARTTTGADVKAESTPEEGEKKPKEPKRGDFNAGGQVRLPNGPGDDGKYATFNWVAFDAKGRYYLLKYITVDGTIPFAVKKPDMALGQEPSIVGGISTRLEAKTPPIGLPFVKEKSEVGVALGAAYMREGAMLLSDKDFPLFAGDFQPGFTAGVISRIRMGKVVDFNFNPQWVYQKGTDESLGAVQIPLSLVVSVGDILKLGTDAGIYTGDDYKFGGDDGGRISTGVSLDVKIGKIITHAGVGFASLLTGGLYPTVKESMYIDLNVKFAK